MKNILSKLEIIQESKTVFRNEILNWIMDKILSQWRK